MRVFHAFELLSLLVSLIAIKKIRGSFLVFFIPFLSIICLYEFGSVSGWFFRNGSNHETANLFMLLPFSFYMVMFAQVFANARVRKVALLMWIGWLGFYCINFFLIQKGEKFNSYTYLLGSLIITGWCCYLFYRIMASPVSLNLLGFSYFWIGTGLMFFYLIRFGYTAYFEFMAYNANSLYILLYDTMTSIAIIILYSCIIIGIICSRSPIRKI